MKIESINNYKDKVKDIWVKNWGSDIMITRGKVVNALDNLGFVILENEEIVGLITFRIENDECEILSLDSFKENKGIGTALLKKVIDVSRNKKLKRIWLITSNDNTYAMRFYQKRGFDFKAIYLNAIEEARKIKPEIPLYGFDNIPVKHEIEMEFIL